LAALDEKLAARAGQPQLAADGSEMDAAETKRSQDEEKRKVEEEIRERRGKDLEEGEKAAGLVWIMYMRSARRSEVGRLFLSAPLRYVAAAHKASSPSHQGHQIRPSSLLESSKVHRPRLAGLRSFRSVPAVPSPLDLPCYSIVCADAFTCLLIALMEYHCSKDPSVATRIFELGLKLFGEKIEFVDRYLAFLITINDDQSKSSHDLHYAQIVDRTLTFPLPPSFSLFPR
jgi:hypothetical protein